MTTSQQYDHHVTAWLNLPFYYDGELLVRAPRILKTIVVPPEAGFAPEGESKEQREYRLSETARKADNERLRRALKVVLSWFDRDEGSSYDMTGYIDYITRAVDSLLENKRTYLKKLRAEARDLERAARADNEFDEQRWIRLYEMEQRILRSGFMFNDALKVHEQVRTEIYSYCGLPMTAFRSRAEMQVDSKQYRKLKISIIDADKLVGLSQEDYAVWKRITGGIFDNQTKPGDDPNPMADGVGGVDALPDETIARGQKDVREHAHKTKKEAERREAMVRTKPRAAPKTDVKIEPSGEKGSRHREMVDKLKKKSG